MSDTEPTHGNNGRGFDREELERFIDALDREEDDLDRMKSEYMTACKGPRVRIKEIMKSAKEAGVDMVAFREVLKTHFFERKQVKRLEELEPDNRMNYDAIMEALGEFADTPLGQSALSKARPAASDGDAALKSL